MPSRFIKLNFELVEYADDGETTLRRITNETSVSDNMRPWQNIQLHGGSLTEAELRGLNMIQQGLAAMKEAK